MIQLEQLHKHPILDYLRRVVLTCINSTFVFCDGSKYYSLTEECMPHFEPLTSTLIAGKQPLFNSKMAIKKAGLGSINTNEISMQNIYGKLQSTNCLWFLNAIKTINKEPDFKIQSL